MATIFNRLISARGAETAGEQAAPAAQASVYRLRPLPNEDVYLYVKRIDNSRVVREADPASTGTCWRTIAVACTVFAVAVGVLLPAAWGVIAGFQIHTLQGERQKLLNEFIILDAEEARLTGPAVVAGMADKQKFRPPAPERVHYLPSKADGAVALNSRSAENKH
jgi:hypothetical protein